MKEREDNKEEEKFNIKVEFYGEKKDLQINSNFNCTIKNMLTLFNIPQNQINGLTLNYFDEDGDSILLSTEEDYKIFFQQIKEKAVDSLILEINNNQKKAPISNLDINHNNEKQVIQENNQINKGINNVVNNNNKGLNNINKNNNINSSNNFNYNNNFESNNNSMNSDIPIDDIIFKYKCHNCSIYPIICILYYCPVCKFYLCEDCSKNVQNHIHPILKIESKKELKKIIDDEKNEIRNINNKDFNGSKLITKNYYPNIQDNNNNYYNNNNFNGNTLINNYPNSQENNYYNNINNNYDPNMQHNSNNHYNNHNSNDRNNPANLFFTLANNLGEVIAKPFENLMKVVEQI